MKTELVVVRIEPEQAKKLQYISAASGHGFNKSAAIRHLIDTAPEPSQDEIKAGILKLVDITEQIC